MTVTDNGDGTLSASVKGATISNKYEVEKLVVDPTEADAEFGIKNVTSTDATGKAKTFSFTLSASDGTPMPDKATVTLSYAAGATGEKTIPFGKITYTKVGEYIYTITEEDPGDGWTVTGNDATVKVTVIDNGDGTLSASVEGATISNKYEVEELVVDPTEAKAEFGIKNVTATDATGNDKEFSFTLAAKNGAPMPDSDTATLTYAAGKTGKQTIPFGKITYTEVGEYTYTITEEDPGDGWTVTGNKATVTVTVTDNGDGTLSASVKGATISNKYEVEDLVIDPTDDEAGTVFGMKDVSTTDASGKAKTFSFTLSSAKGTPMPKNATAALTYAAGATGEKAIPFGEITYNKVGEYTYTITEANPGNGWTVTGNEATVKVIVTDNGDGTLSAEVSGITITNDYAADPVEVDTKDIDGKGTALVTKTVEGEKFSSTTFEFTLTDEDNNVTSANVTASKAGDYVVGFGTLTFEEAGTFKFKVQETNEEAKGWTLDTKEKTITVKVTDDGEGHLKAEVSGATTITNSYDYNEVIPGPGDDTETMDVKSKSITAKYDGKSHTVTAKATKDGSTILFSTDGGSTWSEEAPVLTDVDSITFLAKATNEKYEDAISEEYTLKVTQREVILTSASGTKTFDGTPLRRNKDTDIKVTGDGWASGEGATYDITGEQTNIGRSDNTFTYELNDGTKADNYKITTVLGRLRVVDEEVPLGLIGEVSLFMMTDTMIGHEGKKADDYKTVMNWLKEHPVANMIAINATGNAVEDAADKDAWKIIKDALADLNRAPGQMPYLGVAGSKDVGDDFNYDTYIGNNVNEVSKWNTYEDGKIWFQPFAENQLLIIGIGPQKLAGNDATEEEKAAQQKWVDYINNVIARYPEYTVVLQVNDFIENDPDKAGDAGKLTAFGEFLEENIVSKNVNVNLILCGNAEGTARWEKNYADHKASAIMYNYGADEENGAGFFRLVTLNGEAKTIIVTTYSPVLDKDSYDEAHPEYDYYTIHDAFPGTTE